jgi:phosphate starvation-inducible PhoH-like protein
MTVPPDLVVGLLGSADQNLRALEAGLSAEIHVRGNAVKLSGSAAEVALAERVISELIAVVAGGQVLSPDTVRRSLSMLSGQDNASPAEVLTLDILSRRGKTIRPKTLNQKRYVDAIDTNTVVFGIGPAGTGKTYLAMAKAVQALQTKQVTRIILTRPAVEAGERLGFLPGTLSEKIDPYLRPLYDALHDMMDAETIPKLMAAGVIEVAPLAYMRGRAQPLATKVLTPQGFRAIGDLVVGDLVVGSDGRPTEVLGVYRQGFKDIYRVFTQDGSSTLASGDHLWAVHTREDRRRGKPAQILQTKEMIGNLRVADHHRYELPLLSAPVEFEPSAVPLDPYALGLLLGAGYVNGAMRRLGLHDVLSSEAFVPQPYLLNAVDVRLGVLQGLLDSGAGSLTHTGHRSDRGCRVQFATVSGRLRDDVVFLVQSLGGIAYLRPGQGNGSASGTASRGVHDRVGRHVLDISLPPNVTPFRHAGRAAEYQTTGAGSPRRYIDRIEPTGTEEAVCISVAASDSLYVTEDFLLTHNTLNDSFIILDEAQNTTAEQMKMFLTRLGFGSKIVVTGDITQVDLPGGARSGLRAALDILHGINDIHFSELTSADVVRHRLVADIVDAYARASEDAGLSNRAQRRSSRR